MNGLVRTFLGLFIGWIALMIGSSTYYDEFDEYDNKKNDTKRQTTTSTTQQPVQQQQEHDFLRPFGQYPNILNITKEERDRFHPIVKFPYIWHDVMMDEQDTKANTNTNASTNSASKKKKKKKKRIRVPNYTVLDLQTTSAVDELASDEERSSMRQQASSRRKPKQEPFKEAENNNKKQHMFAVGRYDEHRPFLYASPDLFDQIDTSIDGYHGSRTVHIGIDLDGPVGTPVYSFAGNGIVIASGYNPALGDYGNTIVIKYDLGPLPTSSITTTHGTNITCSSTSSSSDNTPTASVSSSSSSSCLQMNHPHCHGRRVLYVLYGHLDDASVKENPVGKRIRRGGQRIGRMGDIHENGGWRISHVHVQLSLCPPKTHDMPGVVSLQDRQRALLEYPDPRYILGELY